MGTESEKSRSLALAQRLTFVALKILQENGGQMLGREVIAQIPGRIQFDAWATEVFKNGKVRWQSILHFHSINFVKAGFLIKKSGTWFLTPEGSEALKLGDERLYREALEKYAEWRSAHSDFESIGEEASGTSSFDIKSTLDQTQELALSQIQEFIKKMNPYEFQDLIAALLRGMGYYTPFVAPAGRDGGIDIVAYRDPLGSVSPRIRVQIKHRESQVAGAPEIRQLMGLLHKDGDIGLFVSTAGFSAEARATARSANVHVELIDMSRFVSLWQEFYPKMQDEDRIRLPLTSIYFLAPQD